MKWIRDVRALPELLVAALLIAACAPDSATGVRPSIQHPPRASSLIAGAGTALWNADATPVDDGFEFQPTDWTADNFEVPAGASWTITKVLLTAAQVPPNEPTGFLPNAFPIEISFAPNVSYPRNDGPGARLFTYSVSPQQTAPNLCCSGLFFPLVDLLFALPTPVTLGPGKYWLVVGQNLFWWAGANGDAIRSLENDPEQPPGTYAWEHPGGLPRDRAFVLYGPESPTSATSGLQDLVTSFALDHGTENALLAKTRAALAALAGNDIALACSSLADFINQVSALAGKKMTAAQATQLINEATRIRGLLGC